MPTMQDAAFGQAIPFGDGVTVVMDYDSGDGSQELKRAMQKDKIDRIMEKYGIRPIDKQNYQRFVMYNVEEKYRPLLTQHFKTVLMSQGMPYEDFDFGVVQMQYAQTNSHKTVGLLGKLDYESFVAKEKVEIPAAYGEKKEEGPGDRDGKMIDMMKDLFSELRSFKKEYESDREVTSKRISNLEGSK